MSEYVTREEFEAVVAAHCAAVEVLEDRIAGLATLLVAAGLTTMDELKRAVAVAGATYDQLRAAGPTEDR